MGVWYLALATLPKFRSCRKSRRSKSQRSDFPPCQLFLLTTLAQALARLVVASPSTTADRTKRRSINPEHQLQPRQRFGQHEASPARTRGLVCDRDRLPSFAPLVATPPSNPTDTPRVSASPPGGSHPCPTSLSPVCSSHLWCGHGLRYTTRTALWPAPCVS